LKRDQLPAGCPFQPRCDFAEPACANEVQVLEAVAETHEVACRRWRALEVQVRAHGDEDQTVREIGAEPILKLDNVRIGYGTVGRWTSAPVLDVVRDLSFFIHEGETFALVGESGSGKSTVARAVSGLLAPRAGKITFGGTALPGLVSQRSQDLRRRIQYIFQNPDASLNPRARIGTILARPLEVFFDLSSEEVKGRVQDALESVRLDARYVNRFADQLSGGERQRVAIARALVADSRLLICDEILSALDVSVQANVLSLLQRLRREHHLSMLFISHDLAVVRTLADRVGVLFRGQLMELGDVEDVFRPPFHPYTYELLMAVPSIHRISSVRKSRSAGRSATGKQGCAFAGRCPWQIGSICESEEPPWREVSSRHRIRCHISLSDLSARVKQDLAHLNHQHNSATEHA
jgi:peptide/nickel transport system ATP-binding protein